MDNFEKSLKKPQVQFLVNQIQRDGKFSHWESELVVHGVTFCQATAPTFWGAMDCLTEFVFEETVKKDHPVLDHNWFKMEANEEGI